MSNILICCPRSRLHYELGQSDDELSLNHQYNVTCVPHLFSQRRCRHWYSLEPSTWWGVWPLMSFAVEHSLHCTWPQITQSLQPSAHTVRQSYIHQRREEQCGVKHIHTQLDQECLITGFISSFLLHTKRENEPRCKATCMSFQDENHEWWFAEKVQPKLLLIVDIRLPPQRELSTEDR